MDIIRVAAAAFTGYLLGCIQTAYILGRLLKSVDIRKFGSNNAGASNVTALMGWKYGVVTAVADILKATLAVVITQAVFPGYPVLMFVAGAFALIGHIFPFFIRFRGGKGVASLIGMAIGVDIRIALILGAIIVLITLIVDYIAVGSITIYVSMPFLVYTFGYQLNCVLIAAFLAIIGVYKHRINISRIIKHEEKGLRAVIRNKQRL